MFGKNSGVMNKGRGFLSMELSVETCGICGKSRQDNAIAAPLSQSTFYSCLFSDDYLMGKSCFQTSIKYIVPSAIPGYYSVLLEE